MHKYTIGTPIYKTHLNKIKGFRALILKVRKTGKEQIDEGLQIISDAIALADVYCSGSK